MSRAGRKSSRSRDRRKDREDEIRKESLSFTVLPEPLTKELLTLDLDHIQQKLAETFSLTDHNVSLISGSLLDNYTSAVWWAKEQGLSAEQLSGFFTLNHTLIMNIKDKHYSLVENLKEFKKMMLGIGVENPDPVLDGGLTCLTRLIAIEVTEYIYTSLFQHYQLHDYMFSQSQDEEIIGADLSLELPLAADTPFPPPLIEAVPEELYMSYIATPPPTPEQVAPEEEVTSPDPAVTLHTDNDIDMFSQLTAADIQDIVGSVTREMLGGLQSEIAQKLKLKESDFINRINKIHKIADG